MINEYNLPYKDKYIKDLKKEDVKVAISGIIIHKEEDKLVIDDGSGNILVTLSANVGVNSFVKLYGNLLPYEEKFEIHGHFVKNLDNVDKQLYKKAMDVIINSV
ncbi:hypothetical protein CL617_03860 [archaeon]|nr:hypothetical protein [archaeon]|tara:strand:+ start:23239 stop:23550 length:312 start_codon:yes stop_codon:yes gene_type:complete